MDLLVMESEGRLILVDGSSRDASWAPEASELPRHADVHLVGEVFVELDEDGADEDAREHELPPGRGDNSAEARSRGSNSA